MKVKSITIIFAVFLAIYLAWFYYNRFHEDEVSRVEAKLQVDDKGSLSKNDVVNIVREEIAKHPENIINSLESYYKKQKESESQQTSETILQNKNELLHNSNDGTFGNPTSPNKIVVYFDYNCSYCKKTSLAIKKLIENREDIYVIFKELPILGDNSLKESKAALIVQQIAPDKYFKFHTAMMEDINNSDYTKKIKDASTAIGLSSEDIMSKINDSKLDTILQSNLDLAYKLGIRGTPAIIINNVLYPHAMSYENIVTILTKNSPTNKTDE